MNLAWMRMARWALDVILAVWFFLPLKARKNPPVSHRIAALICLLATFPIYVFAGVFPFYPVRFFLRFLAYFLFLRLEKGLSWQRCGYYALILWLSFNICFNILISTDLQDWFFLPQLAQLPGVVLVNLLYVVLITLIREAIPFRYIPEPGGFRIGFALLLSAAQLFIKEVSDMAAEGQIKGPPSFSLYLLLIQLLLGVSLVLFERYQSSSDRANQEQIATIASEYRYQSAMVQHQAAEDIRRLHHDMKNHLLAILQLSGDNERLDSYVKSLMDEIGSYELRAETGNALLNGLVSEKMRLAEREGIDLSVQVDFAPCNEMIKDIDICIIFGNLLDNAIEASCRLSDTARRSILVKSHIAAENMIITFSNFYEGVLQFSDSLPKTTKADKKGHGIGLSSVRRSVEKYGGVLSLDTVNDQRLVLTILLPLPAQKGTPKVS